MKWTDEAEAALSNVPFFVRKKVRVRVEKEAVAENKALVTLAEVKKTQQRFLSGMAAEIKGYQVEACFGRNGCPNRCVSGDSLVARLDNLFQAEDLLAFLKETVEGPLKYHHEFRVAVAECPNACSQPQIRDVSIIAATVPGFSDKPCSSCSACVDKCREKSLILTDGDEGPRLDFQSCVRCGACVTVCPTGTLAAVESGYRVQLGGRLGRHPRLARELPGLFSEDKVLSIVKGCIDFYKKNSRGERFSHLLDEHAFTGLSTKFTE